MVRRTKEDAQATRCSLLDAAEQVFFAQGVSRTSLSDIAVAAGTTRGAIYWHFKDKADLFNAMMERVTLPLENAFLESHDNITPDPLNLIRQMMATVLRKIGTDQRTRQVFEVAMHKVEYVDELRAVQERHVKSSNKCCTDLERNLRKAARLQGIKLAMPARHAGIGLHALADGLIQNWILTQGMFDLVKVGRGAVDAYLLGLGLALPANRR